MPSRKIEIPPLINAYLEILAEIGVYGDEAGKVATFILRKEVMHLIETGVLPNRLPRSSWASNKSKTDEVIGAEDGDGKDSG